MIVADQVIAHFPRHVPEGTKPFGGNAVGIGWPGWTNRLVDLHVWGVQYSLARLIMLALGVAVGVALWLWLYQTKTGMVIRAGVDDRQMTSAIGINIQVFFAIAFAVGAALVALGATVGTLAGQHLAGPGRRLAAQLARRRHHRRHGIAARRRRGVAALRARLGVLGHVPARAGSDCCTQYSPVLTFVLMALVLAFRPQGLFGRAA